MSKVPGQGTGVEDVFPVNIAHDLACLIGAKSGYCFAGKATFTRRWVSISDLVASSFPPSPQLCGNAS